MQLPRLPDHDEPHPTPPRPTPPRRGWIEETARILAGLITVVLGASLMLSAALIVAGVLEMLGAAGAIVHTLASLAILVVCLLMAIGRRGTGGLR